MEIAKLWTRSFDITFPAAWSVGRAGGVPDSEQQLRGHAVRSIAESGGLVLSKKARPSRALFENVNDGHGQNRFTALVHYTVAPAQCATIRFRAGWAHFQHFRLGVDGVTRLDWSCPTKFVDTRRAQATGPEQSLTKEHPPCKRERLYATGYQSSER